MLFLICPCFDKNHTKIMTGNWYTIEWGAGEVSSITIIPRNSPCGIHWENVIHNPLFTYYLL